MKAEFLVYAALVFIPLGVLAYQWRLGLLTRDDWKGALTELGWPGLLALSIMGAAVIALGFEVAILIIMVWAVFRLITLLIG